MDSVAPTKSGKFCTNMKWLIEYRCTQLEITLKYASKKLTDMSIGVIKAFDIEKFNILSSVRKLCFAVYLIFIPGSPNQSLSRGPLWSYRRPPRWCPVWFCLKTKSLSNRSWAAIGKRLADELRRYWTISAFRSRCCGNRSSMHPIWHKLHVTWPNIEVLIAWNEHAEVDRK